MMNLSLWGMATGLINLNKKIMAKYIKPTLKTKFYIDFNWWAQDEGSFHRTLIDQLCDECRATVGDTPEPRPMDWVDPETGQVFTIDQLWHVLHTQCAHKPDFLSDALPITSAVFRLFIANNNTPLSAPEIHQHLHRKSANTILRTIGGVKTYKGIRAKVPLLST